MKYQEFLESKIQLSKPSGFDPEELNSSLFPFQRDIVRWSIRRGSAALFEDCGLGKTLQQLEWAYRIHQKTQGSVLILAPLAVSYQTAHEGEKFGIPVTVCKDQFEVRPGVNITNYEKLQHFSPSEFTGIVLDESSILKSYTGKFRNEIIESFSNTPYRLACTATPAPNDYMELGNHAEFLGVMTRTEMLATYFVHDGGETSKWRLKGHAEGEFWKWLASWAVYIRKPSDLGYEDDGFSLPALNTVNHRIETHKPTEGYLFAVSAATLEDQRKVKRSSLSERVKRCAEIVNASREIWIVWAELNDEADELEKIIHGSIQIAGSDSSNYKEEKMIDFTRGNIRVLITKSSICGFGMNFQHCHNMAFVSLSHSYESFYQAVRRCWRFGQDHPVNVHIFTMDVEDPIIENIQRKQNEANQMADSLLEHMKDLNKEQIKGLSRQRVDYKVANESSEDWTLLLGDAVERTQQLATESIDYSIFSPPFASLYTYSNSERDMGNCLNHDDFWQHFEFLIPHLFRITKPGRLLSFHCMNLPLTKERDGFIGIRDFRGELIRQFIKAGFIFHSEVCIWKDPVTAMQRTKAIGLLYKQLRKDSCISRQGIPDYLVTMRKPGINPDPVTKTYESFPVAQWQRYASPVWFDIKPSRTLQSIREERDERHICPLQLEVIERAIELWTNPNDLVFSPFAGIGSEGYQSLIMGRRFLGIELKEAYYNQAIKNLKRAEQEFRNGNRTLFDEPEPQEVGNIPLD
jgi:superfamily II DNA or RNA helicase